jgi:hypothetical protein
VAAARGDSTTGLPAALERPPHWAGPVRPVRPARPRPRRRGGAAGR